MIAGQFFAPSFLGTRAKRAEPSVGSGWWRCVHRVQAHSDQCRFKVGPASPTGIFLVPAYLVFETSFNVRPPPPTGKVKPVSTNPSPSGMLKGGCAKTATPALKNTDKK